jgi:RNA polymerase sigma-70 factor, ECF subfamily
MIILPDILLLFLAFSASMDVDWRDISKAIKSGDSSAFRTFYDANYPSVYRYLISRGLRVEDVQDLIQKAFLMIWEKRDAIDPDKSLKAYLFQIVYTRMLNHIQYNAKFTDVEEVETQLNSANTDDRIDYAELLRLVRKVVSSMPEKRSMVFDMCFMKEFTYKETAEALQVSVKTVENHMALAFKDLRAALIKTYGEEQVSSFVNLN